MKHKKILVTALLAVFLFPLSVFPVDWDFGGAFTNSTGLVSDAFDSSSELEQINTLTLRFEVSGEAETGVTGNFVAQGRYEYTDDRAFLIDADVLRFQGVFPGILGDKSVTEINAGRFYFSDPSGMVLAHTADGASFRFLYPNVRISLAGGYTGLLVNPSSDIRMTNLDKSEEDMDLEDTYWGPKRVFAQAAFTFPGLWWLDSLSLFTLAQFDLRDDSEGTVVDSQYLGLFTQRRYGQNLYQDLFLIAQAAQYSTPDQEDRYALGLLFGLNFRYLKESWSGSRFNLRMLATPPDIAADDLLDSIPFGVLGFVPMNEPFLGTSVSPELKALGLVELGYSFRPFMKSSSEIASRIQPSVAARGYFRTYSVDVNWIETNDSDSVFIGTELEAGLAWRIFSDLGLTLTGAWFLPATGSAGAASDDMENIWLFRTGLSLSF